MTETRPQATGFPEKIKIGISTCLLGHKVRYDGNHSHDRYLTQTWRVLESTDDPDRQDDTLLDIVPKDPRQVYKMHTILESVCDQGSFFEMGKKWGRSIITGLARLNGIPVAIFAENPRVYGGAWTADASRKLIRLLDLAATFHLPLVHLEDCPGFLIGKQSEEEGTIRFGSAALAGADADTGTDSGAGTDADTDPPPTEGRGASAGRSNRFASPCSGAWPGGGCDAAVLRGSSCAACRAHLAKPSTLPKKPSVSCAPARLRIA